MLKLLLILFRIEYSNQYVKTSLWGNHQNVPNAAITDSESFTFKVKITGSASADSNTKDVKILVALKYVSNFWRTLEKSLINCEINLMLTWLPNCVITDSTGA